MSNEKLHFAVRSCSSVVWFTHHAVSMSVWMSACLQARCICTLRALMVLSCLAAYSMLLKAGSLWAIAVPSCKINFYATLLQNDSWRLDVFWDRQDLVIVIGFRHYFIMFDFVHCCSQLCNDVWMLWLELSSGAPSITLCFAHLCAEQIGQLSHNVFDFGRGSLILVSAVIFWTVLLRIA